jgi:transcription initiation factor TFIID subunit 11
MISGSVAGAGVKKKRSRKTKVVDDAASAVGGRTLTAVSGTSGRNGASRVLTPDEDDDVGQGMDVSIVARTKEENEKEAQHRAMLVGAFDEEQFRRYECWRQARLSDAVVRRVCLTLCQFIHSLINYSSSIKPSHNPFLVLLS